jgi:hypothetical protein
MIECIDPRGGTAHVMCKHCKWTAPHPSTNKHGSTSRPLKHLEECVKYKVAIGALKKKSDVFQERFVMTQSRLVDHVLAIIISGNLSFQFAEDPQLGALLKVAFPSLKRPTRQAIAARLKQVANQTRTKLRGTFGNLDSKVSLALDCWNSRNNHDFLGTIFPHLLVGL